MQTNIRMNGNNIIPGICFIDFRSIPGFFGTENWNAVILNKDAMNNE